jgi:hypothetical protein
MLASDAVSYAYREAAIKRIGSTLTADELAEGLRRLNGFLFSLFSAEIGEKLVDVQVPQNQRATTQSANAYNIAYPANIDRFSEMGSPGFAAEPNVFNLPGNSRIIWKGTAPTTVYLPEYPNDGARVAFADVGSTATLTIHANGRKIENAASITVATASAPAEWFYRADLGDWISLSPLVAADTTPLPQEFDDLLVSGTAIRLTALDQIKPTDGTMFIYDRLLKRCKQRYAQHVNTSAGGEFLVPSVQSFDFVDGPGRRTW